MPESLNHSPQPEGYAQRIVVPEEFRPWEVAYPGYSPPVFNNIEFLTKGLKQGWADPFDPREVDHRNRPSFEDAILFDNHTGLPLNPRGRQGLAGRGELGKWGVNNAADPVVVAIDSNGKRKILLIQRQTGEWALPGGMVDPGENVSKTALRELNEEAGIELQDVNPVVIAQGYVDDPRNTDNAWIETVASLIVINSTPETSITDEVKDARWFDLPPSVAQLEKETGSLYASHDEIIDAAIQKLNT